MTTFPSNLIPSARTYSPGAFPHTAHGVYDGSEARVRHSNTVLGVRLRLFFPAITSAELLTVISHYSGQRGRFLPFVIPNDLLSGVTTPADFTPAGHQWRYAARPTVEDISIVGGTNRHDLTIELETVPPENTIAQGVRLRARASLQAGSAQLGAFFDVYAWLDAGAGSVVDPFLVTATLAAGAAASVVSDPSFANVSLLLPMNGTNGSTTITDASSNAFVGTANGNAQISTTDPKFGTGCLLLDGTGDFINYTHSSALSINNVFTIQAWVRIDTFNALTVHLILSKWGAGSLANDEFAFYYETGTNKLEFDFRSGTTYKSVTSSAVALSTGVYYYLAVSRNGSNWTFNINGTTSTATNSSSINNPGVYGLKVGSWGGYPLDYDFNGRIDELRLTKGVARDISSVPTAAFPTS